MLQRRRRQRPANNVRHSTGSAAHTTTHTVFRTRVPAPTRVELKKSNQLTTSVQASNVVTKGPAHPFDEEIFHDGILKNLQLFVMMMTHAKTPCVVLASRLLWVLLLVSACFDVKVKMLMVAERVPPSKQPFAFSKAKHTNTRVNNNINNPGHTDVIARSPTAPRTRTHIISPRWSR